jgi:uncharacterized protein
MKAKALPFVCILSLCLLPFAAAWAERGAEKPVRILFFNKSAGFEHSVIKKQSDGSTFAGKIVKDLADKNGFEVTETKDGTIFTSPDLAKFDVFLFYTTGDLTQDGKDGKGMGAAGKTALFDAVKGGKGFVALHCGSDTFHSPGHKKGVGADDSPVDPYIAMLGGEFIIHGKQQKCKMVCVDHKFPGFENVGGSFEMFEEWYALKNFAPDLHVILVADPSGMNGDMYQRPPYPATWARMYGKGRVFYSSMGHRDDVWQNPILQNTLVGALKWAAHRVDADVTPNVDKVAPKAHQYTLQPAPAK